MIFWSSGMGGDVIVMANPGAAEAAFEAIREVKHGYVEGPGFCAFVSNPEPEGVPLERRPRSKGEPK